MARPSILRLIQSPRESLSGFANFDSSRPSTCFRPAIWSKIRRRPIWLFLNSRIPDYSSTYRPTTTENKPRDEAVATPYLSPSPETDDGPTKSTASAREQVSGASSEPRLLRVHKAFIGLSLRVVARVANYRGWEDLIQRYDMSESIAFASAHAARAESHYLHYSFLNPATPEKTSTSSSTSQAGVGNKPAAKTKSAGQDPVQGAAGDAGHIDQVSGPSRDPRCVHAAAADPDRIRSPTATPVTSARSRGRPAVINHLELGRIKGLAPILNDGDPSNVERSNSKSDPSNLEGPSSKSDP